MVVKEEVGTCVSEFGFPDIDTILGGSMLPTRGGGPIYMRQLPVIENHPIISLPTEQLVVIPCRKFQKQFEIQSNKFSRKISKSMISTDKNATVDHINRLPDEVLQFIISRLRMKEGAATGVLSRRWRNLWTTSSSVLNFDLTDEVGYNHLIEDSHTRYCLRTNRSFLWNERLKFKTWVNQVLQHHCASKINALRISFLLGKESASHVNQWIQYAANNGLTELELDFGSLLRIGLSSKVAYDFPFELLMTSLKYVGLTGVNFYFPPNFKGFSSLQSLTLKDSFLTEDCLENILSNCSSLECLSLIYCFFVGCGKNLKFSSPSLQLKHLRLVKCNDHIRKIELHDVNIVSLEFHGFSTKLSIKNAPHLARLVLCTGTPVDILSGIPRVETLFMTTSRAKESILPKLNVFNNLKRLVFIVDDDTTNLLQVIYLLETCPSLQKLELDMGILYEERTENLTKIATRPESPYKNLKEIEIYGFQDHLEKIELLKCLLRNAVVLEKMKISTTSRKYLGNGLWTLYEGVVLPRLERIKKLTRRSLSEVGKLLQKEVSCPSTEIKIVSN